MNKPMSLPMKILQVIKNKKSFNTQFLYDSFPNEVKTTIRGRLYNLLDRQLIERIGPDCYQITTKGKELDRINDIGLEVKAQRDAMKELIKAISSVKDGQYGIAESQIKLALDLLDKASSEKIELSRMRRGITEVKG